MRYLSTLILIYVISGCTQTVDGDQGDSKNTTPIRPPAGTMAAGTMAAGGTTTGGTMTSGTSAGFMSGGTTPSNLTVESVCASVNDLERAISCNVTSAAECNSFIQPACLAETAALVECFANNQRGCICESTGSLNCEGAVKENEIPEIGAPCRAQAEQLGACEDIYAGGDEAGDFAGVEAGNFGGYGAGYPYGGDIAGTSFEADYGM